MGVAQPVLFVRPGDGLCPPTASFGASAPKLGARLACGKDWKGGEAVRERSGRMERTGAEPWKAWFWVVGFLSLAKEAHLPKAAHM